MRIAVIDMGTNTFHLLIVDVTPSGWDMVYREKKAVKIGEKGISKGLITEDAIERALVTLRYFKTVIDNHGTNDVFATATSAIRNARNGRDLVALIEVETGIKTRIISGLEEAAYIHYGVQQALEIGQDTSLIMDIGGGSIEFIIAKDNKVLWMQSFEVGGQRLMEAFHQQDPIPKVSIKDLEKHLDHKLVELFKACETYNPVTLIGSSGTFDTLSEIYQKRTGTSTEDRATEFPLTVDALSEIGDELMEKDRSERLAIPGMIPLRVDMIVVATSLIRYVIRQTNLNHVRVSAYALKEGVLMKTIDELPVTDTREAC